jgi:CO/xanthine dehydrogenase Mo-binding subunit
MLFAKLFLSPYPHARVRSIDASEALSMPGVHAILTAEDLLAAAPPERGVAAEEEEGPEGGKADKPRPIDPELGLTNEPVYQGQPVLAVAAVDEVTAANAIERIRFSGAAAVLRGSAAEPASGRSERPHGRERALRRRPENL